MEEENKVNLSAFKVKLEAAKTKVSPRLDLISADCPATSQEEKGEPYTHEAQLNYVVHNICVSFTLKRVSQPTIYGTADTQGSYYLY